MADLFTKTRRQIPQPKYLPVGKPYSAALSAALDDMRAGRFYECLLRCAQIEAEHGRQPWTQLLGVLIRKDRLGERDTALDEMHTIVTNWPGWAEAQYNYGAFLQENGRWADARWHLRKALQIVEDYVPAMVQLGICEAALGNHEAAWRHWDEALRYQPATVRDEYHLAPIFAARGNMVQFMRLQELRWEAQEHYAIDHGVPDTIMGTAEIWQGDSLAGHHLLVLDEQGAGDTIQFARYLPMVCDQAESVWLRLKQKSLRRLITAIEPRVNIVMAGEPLPMATRTIGLMSLFHRGVMVAKHRPAFPQNYVPREGRVDTPLTYGLCWAGATSHPRDAQRSMAWDVAAQLLDAAPNAEWVDFTIGRERPDDPRIRRLAPTDYLDTVRALEGLDALITVDTSVAHLAGAMGIPTYVMVTTLPDMRWSLQGEVTPWYESWALVRQQQPNDWRTVIEDITRRVQE